MAGVKKSSRNRSVVTHKDLVHIGPGTLAGRYFRQFWHPIAVAADLSAGTAKPARLLGEDLTLYRGEGGTVHAVAFRCAHRGTLLAAGWVEDDCIRCMYHGWKYDAEGQCVEQPAEDPPFAKKIRIRSYSTREYLGLIFVYLGEGEVAPFPRYPHYEDQGVLEVLPVQNWPCNYLQVLENFPDIVHVAFVHRNSYLLQDERTGIPTFLTDESEWGYTTQAFFPGGMYHCFQFGMPNITDFRLPSIDDEIPHQDRLHWSVAIDDENSTIFRLRLSRITAEAAARYREKHGAAPAARTGPTVAELGEKIIAGRATLKDLGKLTDDTVVISNAQDYVAQIGQGRITDRGGEHLGRSDLGVILLRKIFEREVRAFAEGREQKKWCRPESLSVKLENRTPAAS
jgi:5,5'-dehydrodivanillate O-demethylase oxygenase subunit